MDPFIRFLTCFSNDLSEIKMAAFKAVPINSLFGDEKISELGGIYVLNNQSYAAVLWHPNHIACVQCMNLDVLSFNFGGCLMATFTYNHNKYACHIHTDENTDNDRMIDWQNFCVKNRNLISNVKIFKPDSNLIGQNGTTEVWGLITKEGNCYSIGVSVGFDSRGKRYCHLRVIKKMNFYQGIQAQNALAKRYLYYHI